MQKRHQKLQATFTNKIDTLQRGLYEFHSQSFLLWRSGYKNLIRRHQTKMAKKKHKVEEKLFTVSWIEDIVSHMDVLFFVYIRNLLFISLHASIFTLWHSFKLKYWQCCEHIYEISLPIAISAVFFYHPAAETNNVEITKSHSQPRVQQNTQNKKKSAAAYSTKWIHKN